MTKIYQAKVRQEICAGLFGLSLLAFLACSLTLAFMSAGPFVLGTEMNANGTVEYLCLGRACEDYRSMDW